MAKLPLALLLALVAAPVPARDRAIPVATPTGPTVSCVSTVGLRTQVRSDRVIDFTVAGKTYRNTLPNACPGLGFEQSFTYQLSTSRLCSVDLITVLQEPGLSRGASCGLGPFQPVTIVKPSH
jgi:hypothetical protein